MGRPKILCYGFYGPENRNLGDQLFQVAFSRLFPEFDFHFTDRIDRTDSVRFDGFFFGGGSFLDGDPNVSSVVIDALCGYQHDLNSGHRGKPICYLGVGAETSVHAKHRRLLNAASVIAIRNPTLDPIRRHTPNPAVMIIPDLVYSLGTLPSDQQRRGVLLMPNACVVPRHTSPQYQHSAWQFFKHQMAETLDCLIDGGTPVGMFAMSTDAKSSDTNAGIEIANAMLRGNEVSHLLPSGDVETDMRLIGGFRAVMTQRYHGIILSELTATPHLTIHHHDKLRLHPSLGITVDYYGANKHQLLGGLTSLSSSVPPAVVIDWHAIKAMTEKVKGLFTPTKP